jgi:hypothetical protein
MYQDLTDNRLTIVLLHINFFVIRTNQWFGTACGFLEYFPAVEAIRGDMRLLFCCKARKDPMETIDSPRPTKLKTVTKNVDNYPQSKVILRKQFSDDLLRIERQVLDTISSKENVTSDIFANVPSMQNDKSYIETLNF